jgi:hypothetical protein
MPPFRGPRLDEKRIERYKLISGGVNLPLRLDEKRIERYVKVGLHNFIAKSLDEKRIESIIIRVLSR